MWDSAAGIRESLDTSLHRCHTVSAMWNARATRRQMIGMLAAASVGLPLLAACGSPSSTRTEGTAPSAAPTPASPPTALPATSVPAAAPAAPTRAAGSGPVIVGGVRLPTYVPYA